ncbi:MAG: asparaginase [Mycobacteriales bacterium]
MPILAEVVRSGVVESMHTGSVLAVDGSGATVLVRGEVDQPIFPRSSNKPLQVVALLAAGWQPGDDEQIALATASHSGEPEHLAVVRRMLAGAGLTEDALRCPPGLPLSEPAAQALLASGDTASSLTMNCSGKHAAMLATCVARGWPTQTYLEVDHPVQQAIARTLAEMAGEPVAHLAVDGCGAPQHALTLRGLARAFTALVRDHPQVTRAMRAHPHLVGGTGRDVTALMERVPGLVAKDGAEGVYAAALANGSAVVLKIADGAGRARTPVLVKALQSLEIFGLEDLATVAVLGGGRVVGEVRATV